MFAARKAHDVSDSTLACLGCPLQAVNMAIDHLHYALTYWCIFGWSGLMGQMGQMGQMGLSNTQMSSINWLGWNWGCQQLTTHNLMVRASDPTRQLINVYDTMPNRTKVVGAGHYLECILISWTWLTLQQISHLSNFIWGEALMWFLHW